MDYGRMKELAEAFVGRGCVEYPSELEGVLRETATTGIVRIQWSLLCPVLCHRLEQEINSAFCSSESELEEGDREMRQQLLKQLDNFENPPFTVQRLCELVLQPKKHYKKVGCYMRAVEKNLLVVRTQEPDLEWMKSPRLLSGEKSCQNSTVKENGTHITKDVVEEPRSPPEAPPPVDKDSPPTAPTSTWSNLHEGAEGKEGATKRTLSPPLPSRKRSRDTLEQEEDKSSITVRQEADSTVNFEPPVFDPPAPLFEVVDEAPSKRSRESEVDGVRSEGVRSEGVEEKMEAESALPSSSELMETATAAGVGEGEQRLGEQISKSSETVSDKRATSDGETPDNQDVKQVLAEGTEAMITS